MSDIEVYEFETVHCLQYGTVQSFSKSRIKVVKMEEFENERQKVAILKEVLESIACPSKPSAETLDHWFDANYNDLVEVICNDTTIAREALKKLREME